jgi:hypothetical protein
VLDKAHEEHQNAADNAGDENADGKGHGILRLL